MSFSKYLPEDSVVSSETIIRGLWSNDSNTLTTFFTSSNQNATTALYFVDVYNNVTSSLSSSIQFDLTYGHISGSGSLPINAAVTQSTPTRSIYGQYRNLVYGDENTNFTFNSSQSQDIFVINVSRTRYKESLKAGSLNLKLSGSSGTITLTDDSNDGNTSAFLGSNRYYNIVSGSNGTSWSGSIDYGILLPDIGIIILCPTALNGYVTTPARTSTAAYDYRKLFNAISASGNFILQSQETVSSRWFFTRVKNQEFNYTTNPSIIDNDGNLLYSTLIDNPQTYITTVGLYDDNNELLAVAKVSRPIKKDFVSELLLRIKLEF